MPLSSNFNISTVDHMTRETESTLTIFDVQPSDGRVEYVCLASNLVGAVEASANLTVFGKHLMIMWDLCSSHNLLLTSLQNDNYRV